MFHQLQEKRNNWVLAKRENKNKTNFCILILTIFIVTKCQISQVMKGASLRETLAKKSNSEFGKSSSKIYWITCMAQVLQDPLVPLIAMALARNSSSLLRRKETFLELQANSTTHLYIYSQSLLIIHLSFTACYIFLSFREQSNWSSLNSDLFLKIIAADSSWCYEKFNYCYAMRLCNYCVGYCLLDCTFCISFWFQLFWAVMGSWIFLNMEFYY